MHFKIEMSKYITGLKILFFFNFFGSFLQCREFSRLHHIQFINYEICEPSERNRKSLYYFVSCSWNNLQIVNRKKS